MKGERRRRRVRLLAVQGLLCGSAMAGSPLHGQEAHPLPAVLEDLYLVLVPVTEAQGPLRLQVNSGGLTFLLTGSAQRAGVLAPDTSPPEASLPRFRQEAWIPGLVDEAGASARLPVRTGERGPLELDGELGADWLRGRTWTFDYPGRALLMRDPGNLPLHGPGERLALELGAEEPGGATVPVVRVELAGESLAAAIHTRSGAELTEEAVAAIGDLRPRRRAITRMAASDFDALRARHPEWRLLEGAEEGTGQNLLEVQGLALGATGIPRLWVLRTSDDELQTHFEASAPESVSLLLGGDVLREFRVTLDFVGGVAIFEPAGFP